MLKDNRVQVKYWGDKLVTDHLDLIIRNAWKYRLLFIDTEEGLDVVPPSLPQRFYSYKSLNEKPTPICGTVHIPEPLPSQGAIRSPRLTVQIADFEANVYIFREFDQLPEEVKSLLDEFRITKIQSNIFKDVKELDKAGIRVRGWADSQLVYRAFVNQNGSKCGTDGQATDLGFETYPFWNKNAKKFEEKGCHFDYPHLSIREILHATQDVRIPAACLLKAAILQAQATNMTEDENVYPVVMEAIDLVKSLDTEGRLENLNNLEYNWRPETYKCLQINPHPRPSHLNKTAVVSRMKKARADFVEPAFEEGKRPTDEELTKVINKFWQKEKLPGRGTAGRSNYHRGYEKVCQNCGSYQHKINACPNLLVPCQYPHSKTTEPHAILTCPELSQFCIRCFTRGHFCEAHNIYTKRQLENNFLRHCHQGLFTCFPYHELISDQRCKLLNYHWMFSLYEMTMPLASIVASRLSLPAEVRFGEFPRIENRQHYEKNAEKRRQIEERLLRNKDNDEASEHESDRE